MKKLIRALVVAGEENELFNRVVTLDGCIVFEDVVSLRRRSAHTRVRWLGFPGV